MKLPDGVEDHMRHYNQGDEVEVRVLSIQRGGEKVALTQKSDDEIATEERTRTRGLSAGERYY
jgi:predicted RNA-binding protein with RPS1 domain